jgi:tubulin polyglutamylase TTLL6/13
MNNIYLKNNLGRNLNKMKLAMSKEYDFFPKTWMLPLEYRAFLNEFEEAKKFKMMIAKC